MRLRKLALCLLLAITTGLLAFSQEIVNGKVPDDVPNATLINAYVAAFNSGEEAMAVFLKSYVAEGALKQRSVESRLDIYQQMRGRMKSLEIKNVPDVQMSGQAQSVAVLMKTGGGDMVNITFHFDPNPPNKLLSLTVEDADSPQVARGEEATTNPMTEAEFVKKVDGYLDDLAKKDAFSGVALVAHGGKTVFQKAYGFADQVKKTPNNLDTKFNLGSINKMFTSIAIGQLVSAGKMSFDDKLGKFLPDYPNRGAAEKVTVRQLLNMKSGIGDFFNERYEAIQKAKIRNLDDWLPLFADKPLLFEPGTQQRYSNGGFLVLGLIIEKVSGENYFDYVKKHIFLPAGMKDTDSYFTDQRVSSLAEGYTTENSNGKGRINNLSSRPARGSSAGGGYSTARDLYSFTKAIANKTIVTISMDTGQPTVMAFARAGGAPGTNADFEFEPQSGNAIIILSNYDPPSAERPAQQVRAWMKSVREPQKQIETR